MTKSNSELELIQAAYSTSVKPEQLEAFEMLWESYIDSELASSEDTDLKIYEINKHIGLALDILSRVNHVRDTSVETQKIVDSEYGLRFLFDRQGIIFAANSDSAPFLKDCKKVQELDINLTALKKIQSWISTLDHIDSNKFLFVHAHWFTANQKNCLFITPIEFKNIEFDSMATFYLATLVDFGVIPDVIPAIRATYQLTEAEGDVAMRLANGQTPEEISDDRKVAISTIRTQVQNILKKTETRTISEMVTIVTGMSAKFSTMKSQTETIIARQKEKYGILRPAGITLSDGRYLQYFEQGHPNGIPVILLHSLLHDVCLSQASAKAAVLQGLRIITPIRAGYGDSDPYNNTNITSHELVDAGAKDLHKLIQHLGLSEVVLMSGWAGCFAQRFAINYPESVAGLLLLNTVPLWDDSFLRTMRTRHRNIVKTSIHAPQVVPYLARVGKALMDSDRGEFFAYTLDKDRAVDLAALKNPDNLMAITRGFDKITKQSVRAFAQDLLTVHTDWIVDAKKLNVPVTILVGSENKDFPEVAFQRYQDAVPEASIKSVKGGGTYLHYTHFSAVAKELQRLSTSTKHHQKNRTRLL